MYRLCELLSKMIPCPANESVRHEEKYNSKSYLHWGSTGISEVKGLHLMERGRSVSLDMESAASQWKLPCLLWEASLKTGSELVFLFPVLDFTSRKGSLTCLKVSLPKFGYFCCYSVSFVPKVLALALLVCLACLPCNPSKIACIFSGDSIWSLPACFRLLVKVCSGCNKELLSRRLTKSRI